jgi:hypothetical protein
MDQGFLKATHLYLRPIISTNLVYKEESLFFMHSVPVRARTAKLCMAHTWVQGNVKTGLVRPRGLLGGIPPSFRKIGEIFYDFSKIL